MKDIEEIYGKICRLNGKKPGKNIKDFKKNILKELAAIENKLTDAQKAESKNERRVNDILDVVMALANLNYQKKATVSRRGDHLDALALGINMLGEELQSSTISLQEKEVLLKEIHHRVKNNLQVISSLLNLQTEYFTDKHSLEKFNESRNRVKSMSLVHEKLYKSKDLSRIDFKEYLEELVLSISSSYNLDNDKISTEVIINLKDRLFNIDTAIPCGLIVNELLSNCYKYAFPDKREGKIKITFSSRRSGKNKFFYLQVEDNGVGISPDTDVKNASTLGLQLVYLLVEQLGGELKITLKKGSCFLVSFKI